MLIKTGEDKPTKELDEVATFITYYLEEDVDTEDTSEVYTWVCELLELYHDNFQSSNAYMVDINFDVVTKAISERSTYATFAI